MKIAVHGLGKMGMQIAQKLVADGHQVIAHNRSSEPMEQAAAFGATAAATKQAVLEAFTDEPVAIWLMLPDTVVEAELTAWLEVVPAGSLIIDGGNSDFRLTQKHAELTAAKNVQFLDVGTSGGVMGLSEGFCMMAGGDEAVYQHVEPVLKSLAAPRGAYDYFGPHGAGHFVKMVHNAIEYGIMESLAEGYQILKKGPYQNLDLAKAGAVWERGSVIASLLNRLAMETLAKNPSLEGADGYVAESGEARWTLEVAAEHSLPAPAIQAAMDVRKASQAGMVDFRTQLLAELRHAFGGHDINKKAE